MERKGEEPFIAQPESQQSPQPLWSSQALEPHPAATSPQPRILKQIVIIPLFPGAKEALPPSQGGHLAKEVVATKCLWFEVFGCEEGQAGTGAAGQYWLSKAHLHVSVAVEGKLTDVPAGKRQGCNPEGK